MAREIVIAVDTEERTPDTIALGRLLAETTGAPARLVTVFPYALLEHAADPHLVRLRDDAERTLGELARERGLTAAAAEVIPARFAARELQHVSERAETGLVVVGSTTRGAVGRLLIGGVGERLLAGSASPVALAPRGYAESAPDRLSRIGVGVDDSDESQRALEAAIMLARAAGAELRIITAFLPIAFGGVPTTALASASANEEMKTGLRAVNDAAVAAARDSVAVEGRFLDGPAELVLREQSSDLDLLVAGSRGYGPHAAVLLGSTTAPLMHEATSPVLLTPRGTRLDLG
jgi:nucleotide-binding universal stress UspA family protein